MKISYFKDTDTLRIELNEAEVLETQRLNEDTSIELGSDGGILAISLAHASTATDLGNLLIEKEQGYILQIDKAFI